MPDRSGERQQSGGGSRAAAEGAEAFWLGAAAAGQVEGIHAALSPAVLHSLSVQPESQNPKE
jgi:hypothetical protein